MLQVKANQAVLSQVVLNPVAAVVLNQVVVQNQAVALVPVQ